MSERNDDDRTKREQTEREAFDARVSAAMDGTLDPAERAALDREIASDPARAERARELHGVDAALRELAAEPLEADRLERNFDALRARLGVEEGVAGGVVVRPAWWRRSAGPILAVAAAALVAISLVSLSRDDRDPEASPERMAEAVLNETGNAQSGEATSAAPSRHSDEAISVALGYGDDPAALQLAPGVPIEDLEIIESLELLEFLATRQEEGRG